LDYSIAYYAEADLRKEKGAFLTGGLYLLDFLIKVPLLLITNTFSYPKTIQAPPPTASIPRGLKRKPKPI